MIQPLATALRPTSLADCVGQQHILGAGKPLQRAVHSGAVHSMILWGPPGTGKTTIATIIANSINAHLETLSAVTSGVKDIRDAIANAKLNEQQFSRQTILLVDEVHRFNKAQQDAFLPVIEDGTVVFIGATTENPSFALNNALLSRARVYVLQPLSAADLSHLVQRALPHLSSQPSQIAPDALQLLLHLASGDARRLLNILEIADQLLDGGDSICKQHIELAGGNKVAQFDKSGDQHYDLLSAFHKSVRGSAPDAALYWFTRLLVAGAEATAIARRLLAIASEDIGNADPRALQLALTAWDVYHRVGPAEGERAIAQAVLYCASAAKSNAVYRAFKSATALAEQTSEQAVPMHLRNAPTQLLSELGAGQGYRYAHEEPEAFAAGENYFPEALRDTQFYFPAPRGLEKQIKAKLEHLRALDKGSERRRYD